MKLKLITLLITLSIVVHAYGQSSEYPIMDTMIKEAEFIVYGEIVEKYCRMNEVGVLDCLYTFVVDSVLKGDIPLSEIAVLNDSATSIDDLLPIYRGIRFHRNCFYNPLVMSFDSQDCLERRTKYALFSIESPDIYYYESDVKVNLYKPIDRLLGVQILSGSFRNSINIPRD